MQDFFQLKFFTLCRVVAFFSFCVSGQAIAEDYPSKPIRIIAPYAAGSTSDIVALLVAAHEAERFGKQVIVENKPGANGFIGAAAAAKAAPDGYTLLIASSTTLHLGPSLYRELPLDPIKDLSPITKAINSPFFLITGPDYPANSLKEFVAAAKAKRGKLTIGHKSLTAQLTIELFKQIAGIDAPPVPYKDGFAAFVDLGSGQLDAMLEAVLSSSSLIKAGKAKVLAITSAERSSITPNVPTIAESGYPGFDAGALISFYSPVGTPRKSLPNWTRR